MALVAFDRSLSKGHATLLFHGISCSFGHRVFKKISRFLLIHTRATTQSSAKADKKPRSQNVSSDSEKN
jgi:hypothetical protein